MAGTTTNFSWPFPTNPDPALVASDVQSLASAIDATLGNAWTAYTPAWTAATVNPVINNGTIFGRFKRFGNWGIASGQITMGGATTFGTGEYRFGLPAGWTANTGGGVSIRGIGAILDSSTSTNYVGYMYSLGSPTTLIMRVHNTTSAINPTVPVTFAASDVIYWEVVLELV